MKTCRLDKREGRNHIPRLSRRQSARRSLLTSGSDGNARGAGVPSESLGSDHQSPPRDPGAQAPVADQRRGVPGGRLSRDSSGSNPYTLSCQPDPWWSAACASRSTNSRHGSVHRHRLDRASTEERRERVRHRARPSVSRLLWGACIPIAREHAGNARRGARASPIRTLSISLSHRFPRSPRSANTGGPYAS